MRFVFTPCSTPRPPAPHNGHHTPTPLQDFHPWDGQRFLSAGMDSMIKIWSIKGGSGSGSGSGSRSRAHGLIRPSGLGLGRARQEGTPCLETPLSQGLALPGVFRFLPWPAPTLQSLRGPAFVLGMRLLSDVAVVPQG